MTTAALKSSVGDDASSMEQAVTGGVCDFEIVRVIVRGLPVEMVYYLGCE